MDELAAEGMQLVPMQLEEAHWELQIALAETVAEFMQELEQEQEAEGGDGAATPETHAMLMELGEDDPILVQVSLDEDGHLISDEHVELVEKSDSSGSGVSFPAKVKVKFLLFEVCISRWLFGSIIISQKYLYILVELPPLRNICRASLFRSDQQQQGVAVSSLLSLAES